MMSKPMKTLELHYPMIQFLIVDNTQVSLMPPGETCVWKDRGSRRKYWKEPLRGIKILILCLWAWFEISFFLGVNNSYVTQVTSCDILDFSNCPLSRVLHVTLANWQGFGFEFHLSEYMDIGLPAEYFIACYTVLTRPNKVETAVHGCNCWLSVWTLSCRCPVKLFT